MIITHNSGNGEWWAVDLTHVESLQHHFIEGCISPTGQETVQLVGNTRVSITHAKWYFHTHYQLMSIYQFSPKYSHAYFH